MGNRLDTRERARRLGPDDHGLVLELEEFEAADFEPGFRYDLVDGRLEVTPAPDLPHDEPLFALDGLLREYAVQHPGAFDYLSFQARVYPAGKSTVGPDLVLFRGPGPGLPRRSWRDLAPILVVEVLSPSHPGKDLVRNRRLYATVASVREYWIVDPRKGQAGTTLLVLVRDEAGGWIERPVPAGGRYETPCFPGLLVDLSLPDLGLGALLRSRNELTRAEGRAGGGARRGARRGPRRGPRRGARGGGTANPRAAPRHPVRPAVAAGGGEDRRGAARGPRALDRPGAAGGQRRGPGRGCVTPGPAVHAGRGRVRGRPSGDRAQRLQLRRALPLRPGAGDRGRLALRARAQLAAMPEA